MKHLMLLLMAALLASCGSPAVFERPVMEMPWREQPGLLP